MPLGTEVGLGLGDIVLDGGPATPRKGAQQPPTFRPMFIVAKRSPISQLLLSSFWATVCKTVRPILSVCLSVCDVGVCGQTVGWIKMPLGTEVGLGLGDVVLGGPSSPSLKGTQPPIFGQYLL